MDEGEAVHDQCQARCGEAQAGDSQAGARRQLLGRPPPPAMRKSTTKTSCMSTGMHVVPQAVLVTGWIATRTWLCSQGLRAFAPSVLCDKASFT